MCSLRPPSQRDARSDVRSLPLTAEGWKMRHHGPDIKDGPPIGVNIQKRLAGVIKTHQLLLALCYCNKLTLGKKTACRGTTCVKAFAQGDTPEVSEKRACQHELLLADVKMRLMVLLKLHRGEIP